MKALNKSYAIISFNPSGIILDANDNFLNVVGYEKEDIIGHHHSMFVSEKERETKEYQSFGKITIR